MPTPTLEWGCRQSTVVPGGRCWIWWPKGLAAYGAYDSVDPGTRVPTGWKYAFPGEYAGTTTWAPQWAREYTVKADETPGAFNIVTGLDGYSVTVTVVAAAAARPKRYVRTANWNVLQGWLNDGYDIVLEDSHYWATSQLSVPAGAQIWGYGATIIATANGETANAVFKPLGNFGLYGVTLTHDNTINERYFGSDHIRYIRNFPVPAGAELTISDCTILRGGLIDDWGTGSGGNVIERCDFRGGILGSCPLNTVIRECRWRGKALNFDVHVFWNRYGNKCLFANLKFDDTCRGMTFVNDAIFGCMGIGLQFNNLRSAATGQSEVILFETARPEDPAPANPMMHDNTFLGVQITNCNGPGISLYGDYMKDNIFWSCDIETEGECIQVSGLHELAGQGANLFRDCQLSGPGISLIGSYGQQAFTNCQCIETAPGRGNAGPYGGWYNRRKRLWPVEKNPQGWAEAAQTWTTCHAIPLNGGEFQITSDTPLYVSTTDATVTTIATIPLYEDREYTIEATVKGEGVSNRGMLKNILMAHRATAGAAVLDNTTAITVDDAVPGAWAFTATASGNNILLRVTGEVANTIEWKVIELKIKEIEA